MSFCSSGCCAARRLCFHHVSLAERIPFDRAPSLDARWHGAKARRFLEAVRKFVADSDLASFTESPQQLYDLTNSRLRAFVAKNADLPWFDRFFGARAHAPFHVIPGLVNGGSSYGAHVALSKGVEEIYAIPGIWKVDSDGLPDFDPRWTSTLVHEFTHSYVGPLIDKFGPPLEKSGDHLFEAANEEMHRQGPREPDPETSSRRSRRIGGGPTDIPSSPIPLRQICRGSRNLIVPLGEIVQQQAHGRSSQTARAKPKHDRYRFRAGVIWNYRTLFFGSEAPAAESDTSSESSGPATSAARRI